jgi:hypothetical protein
MPKLTVCLPEVADAHWTSTGTMPVVSTAGKSADACVGAATRSKVAVMVDGPDTVRAQGCVPLQEPDQPTNRKPDAGVALTVRLDPAATLATQSAEQEMP